MARQLRRLGSPKLIGGGHSSVEGEIAGNGPVIADDTGPVLLRPARPADAMEVAHVHVRSWQAAYRGLLPDDVLDGLRPEDRAARYTFGSTDPAQPATLVAVVGGAIRGFATTMPTADEEVPDAGQLGALYVDPICWGDGVGRALIEAVRGRLVGAGFGHAVLWVLLGNRRAIRFYERDGWRADGSVRQEVVWGVPVDEVRYRRRLSSESEPATR